MKHIVVDVFVPEAHEDGSIVVKVDGKIVPACLESIGRLTYYSWDTGGLSNERLQLVEWDS